MNLNQFDEIVHLIVWAGIWIFGILFVIVFFGVMPAWLKFLTCLLIWLGCCAYKWRVPLADAWWKLGKMIAYQDFGRRW